MKRLRLIFLVALAAVVLGSLLAYWLNPPVRLPVLEEASGGKIASDGRPRMQGMTYTQVEQGRKKWTLSSQGARYDEAKGIVTLNGVKVVFYPERGGFVTIEGDEGQYYQKKKIIVLRGHVRGRTNDGMTLVTDLLTYSEPDQVVHTDHVVTVAGPRFSVTGKGMTVVVPDGTVTFHNQVHSTFVPEGKGPPHGATVE